MRHIFTSHSNSELATRSVQPTPLPIRSQAVDTAHLPTHASSDSATVDTTHLPTHASSDSATVDTAHLPTHASSDSATVDTTHLPTHASSDSATDALTNTLTNTRMKTDTPPAVPNMSDSPVTPLSPCKSPKTREATSSATGSGTSALITLASQNSESEEQHPQKKHSDLNPFLPKKSLVRTPRDKTTSLSADILLGIDEERSESFMQVVEIAISAEMMTDRSLSEERSKLLTRSAAKSASVIEVANSGICMDELPEKRRLSFKKNVKSISSSHSAPHVAVFDNESEALSEKENEVITIADFLMTESSEGKSRTSKARESVALVRLSAVEFLKAEVQVTALPPEHAYKN